MRRLSYLAAPGRLGNLAAPGRLGNSAAPGRLGNSAAPGRLGNSAAHGSGGTRSAVVLALLGLVLVTALAAPSAAHRGSGARATPTVQPSDALAALPLSFEPSGEGGFVSRGPGYSVSLSAAAATIGVRGGSFSLRPAGPLVDPAAPLAGGDPLLATVNRFQGDDPGRWTSALPTFATVAARQVWPGVDMRWHGDGRRLEHDVVVAPGADPAAVALDVDGARSLAIEADGGLALDLGGATARLDRPVVYQDVAGRRRPVEGGFVLLGPSRIGFRVGPYDHRAPLVIDPTLATSTFLGGTGNDAGYGVAVDQAGNTYVTGSTESTDFPTATPLQPGLASGAPGPSTDVFVTKLSPDGSSVVWSTYLGGKGRDTGYAVAVGTDGSVYVTGVTESADFPRVKAAQDNYGGGPSDAFVVRITPNGSAMEWSTFLGGTSTDRARGLAVDASGNAYVTGSTSSVDFPAVDPQQPGPFRPDDVDAFLTKIPASGAPLAYSTRLGGSNDDHGLAVAVNLAGEAFVTGDTLSPGFPTVRPLQATSGGSASGVAGSFPDAFVSRFNASGSGLVYSTFLGGSDYDQGTAIAVDSSGAAYVGGSTNSPNFPTVNPLQPRKDGDADAFAAKLDPTGASLVYSTYLGGGGADGANAIAVDGSGNAYLAGTTGSTNWPTTRPTQAAKGGGDDAFVTKLAPSGSASLFSTYLGGRDSDSAMALALDGQGAVRVLGLTTSSDFPQVKRLAGSRWAPGGDAFVARLSLADANAPSAGAGSTSGSRAAAGSSAATSSSTGHDRRVRFLAFLTFALLLAAGLQTLYLRRHTPVPAATRPPPAPARLPATAPSGLRVLDDAGIGAGSPKPGPPKVAAANATGAARSGAGPKGNRSPKARGGPKGAAAGARGPAAGAAAKGGGPRGVGPKGVGPRPRPAAGVGEAGKGPVRAAPGGKTDEHADAAPGEPTMAVPVAPARPRPQEPGVAQLLEEDLWAPLPVEPGYAPEPDLGGLTPLDDHSARRDRPEPPGATQPVAEPGERPGDAIQKPPPAAPPPPAVVEPQPSLVPPVPAEELSFWDLFPEDLPPARPSALPVDDLLAVALPDGPDSVAARHLTELSPPDVDLERPADLPPPVDVPPARIDLPPPIPPMEIDADRSAPPPPTPRRPRPSDAEIVVAEVLDGPAPPTTAPSSADSIWAPAGPDDDFLIDDLLDPPLGAAPPVADVPPGRGGKDAERAGTDTAREERARLAADQARRRRARRGGRGKRPGSG